MGAGGADLGRAFAESLAAKDFARVTDLLHPQVDFAGLTPSRASEAHDVEQQACLTARDGRIGWLRVVCSGFRAPGDAR